MGTQPHRSPAQAPPTVRLPIRADLRGRLVRRYKRFLADIETETGEVITVHCPNPGAMTGTDRPGSAVRCSTSDNPKRKLPQTLEMVRVGRIWVGVHTLRANQLVARALAANRLPGVRGYARVVPEVQAGAGSRLDFGLADGEGRTEHDHVGRWAAASGVEERAVPKAGCDHFGGKSGLFSGSAFSTMR
mgnify:CR=1 FL=1